MSCIFFDSDRLLVRVRKPFLIFFNWLIDYFNVSLGHVQFKLKYKYIHLHECMYVYINSQNWRLWRNKSNPTMISLWGLLFFMVGVNQLFGQHVLTWKLTFDFFIFMTPSVPSFRDQPADSFSTFRTSVYPSCWLPFCVPIWPPPSHSDTSRRLSRVQCRTLPCAVPARWVSPVG